MCPVSLVGEHAHVLIRQACLGVLLADRASKPMYQASMPTCCIGRLGKHTHVQGKYAYCSY